MKKKKPLLVALTDTHLNKDNVELNRSIFLQAIQVAKDNGLQEIYHLGDIFDSRLNQSLRTLLAFKSILNDFKKADILLIAIPGNHDKVDYESDRSYLDVYSDHPNFDLYSTPSILPTNEVDVCLIPYYKETTVYKSKVQELLNIVDGLPISLIIKPMILLTHCAIRGVRNNDGSIMGEKETPPMECFKRFDKIFVGHYHNMQILNEGQIIYPGASMPHNYGEDNEKGIMLLYNDLSWAHVETDFPNFIKLEFKVGEDDIAKLLDVRDHLRDDDHYRIEVIGTSAEVQAFDKTIFTKHGIEVKKKSREIETNVTMVQETVFESHTIDSITKEFEVFCQKNKIPKSDRKIGDKYIKRLEHVEF